MSRMKFLNNKTNSSIKEYKNWLQQKGIEDTLDHFYDWADTIDCNKLVRELI